MTVEADTLVDGFVRLLSTATDAEGVLDQDVFADFNVPHWRFQIQGARELSSQLRADAPNGSAVTVERCLRTSEGFVLECAYVQDDHVGDTTVYRTAWIVRVDEGRIREVVLYCTGAWDHETQRRQATEAPMLRG